jgi:hypothetical protein
MRTNILNIPSGDTRHISMTFDTAPSNVCKEMCPKVIGTMVILHPNHLETESLLERATFGRRFGVRTLSRTRRRAALVHRRGDRGRRPGLADGPRPAAVPEGGGCLGAIAEQWAIVDSGACGRHRLGDNGAGDGPGLRGRNRLRETDGGESEDAAAMVSR